MQKENSTKKTQHTTPKSTEQLKKTTFIGMAIVLITGIVMILLLSFHKLGQNSWQEYVSRVGCGLLIAGASMSAGGFLGFIFGIPSLLQASATAGNGSTALVKYNDNLVQISDWLTKIIVGVGLTQLGDIPGKVLRLGDYLAINFSESASDWGRNASLAIVFYFLLFGFLMIYFWTRTDFTRIMKGTDDDLQAKLEEKTEKLAEKETMLQEEIKKKEEIKEKIEKISLQKETIMKHDEEKASRASNVEVQLGPIIHTDDPQKGRFGGKAESNGRKLSAIITETADPEWFNVSIKVESTDSAKPLDSEVIFYLHDTFRPSVYPISPINGVAEDNEINAWGAFTVGAVADNGQTLLELDLSQLPEAPKKFRER